jgi:hypothetical protein
MISLILVLRLALVVFLIFLTLKSFALPKVGERQSSEGVKIIQWWGKKRSLDFFETINEVLEN